MKRKKVAVLLTVSLILSSSIGVSAAEIAPDTQNIGIQTVTEVEVETGDNVELPVANVMNVDFTGGDATDKSEMANSCQTFGNPVITDSSELHKKVVHFDGSSAYLYPFDDTKYEKITDAVTIECMFKYDSIPSSGEYDMFSNQQSGGIGLGLENGALNFFAHVDGGYKQPKATIQVGQWVHAVGVVDGSAVKLYVNGKLVDQIAANGGVKYPSGAGAKNFVIGGDSDNSSGVQSYAEGYVSFAKVYDKALNEKEIAALSAQAFEGADIEEVQPQQVNLGIVASETAPAGGEMSVNLHANGAEVGSVDKITYELNYDANLLTYSGVQYNVSGLTIDDSTAGKLKVTYEGGLSVADFKQYSATRLGQLLFKVKETNANTQTTLKTENFQAFAQDEDVTGKMNVPQAEKNVSIYTDDALDLNGDGVVGAGDVALAGNQDQKKAIAEEAAIYPYKHAVILTTDGGGSAWSPEWIYYTNSTQTLPAKTSDPAIMAKRTNEYTMKLFNEEFATSYTATAVEPSISGQNYSAILHGIPWKDADAAHQVTNDSASREYYGDFGLATAKYPSMFKAVQKEAPSRSLSAFSEWTEILNGIIEPDAGVVGRPSASKESFYDVAKYIKSNEYKNTAIVYMQSDWMDHVGHSTGYYNDTYWTEYKQYDNYFKAVVDALKETGTYDETLIIANADHGGSGTGHGSTDPSNMDIFIGIGGQTVNSGKRLEGGNNSDIAAIALDGLRVEKPESMTGKVFDDATFLTQEEMAKKNRDIEKVAFVRTGETGTLTLSNAKKETRVIDAVIDLGGVSVKNIDAAGGTILRQEVEEGQLKLTIAYEKQPEKLAEITFDRVVSEQTEVNEIMLGTAEGKEVYPDLENTTKTIVAPTQVQQKVQTITAKNITKTYGAKAFNIDAKTNGDGKLTYTSGDKKVIAVSAEGKVTIKGYGKTTITVKAAETKEYKAAEKKITITIKPQKQKVSSLKSSKAKTITVKWKKDTKATGYILQYSTDKNFKKNVKSKTISNSKTTSAKITKLKTGKKYYVKICSYKKISGAKLKGSYSAVKSVKVIK